MLITTVSVSPATVAELIVMPFALLIWMGRRNHVLDGGADFTLEGAIMGSFWPIKNHWQSLLCSMQQMGSFNLASV